MTYLHWPGTGVGCKNFYETLFARAAAMLQELQKFAVYYNTSEDYTDSHSGYYNTKYNRPEPRVKFCKVNSFVTGSLGTFPWRRAENNQFQSHDLKKKSMLSWDTGPCCKPFLLMLLATDDGHATGGELIHFTSPRYRFHHCGDSSGGTLHAMHA